MTQMDVLRWTAVSQRLYEQYLSASSPAEEERFVDAFLATSAPIFSESITGIASPNTNHNTGKCALMQLVSRCLKLKRTASHPERTIGMREQKRSKTTSSCNNATCSVPNTHTSDIDNTHTRTRMRDVLTHTVCQNLEHIFRSAFTDAHFDVLTCTHEHSRYFAMCLFSDLIKELKDQPETSPKINVASSVLQILKDYYCNLKQHSDWDSLQLTTALKLLDILPVLVSSSSNATDTTRCIDILDVLCQSPLAECPSPSPSPSQFVPSRTCCDFIALRVPSDKAWSQLFSVTVVVLNHSLSRFTAGKFDDDVLTLSRIFQQLIQSSSKTGNALTDLLSNNDKRMITCLLSMLEVELRCRHILQCGQPLTAEWRAVARDMLMCVNEASMNSTANFVLFVCKGLCCDASVLCDLLAGNETNALKYVLRMTKELLSTTTMQELHNAAAAVAVGGYQCRGRGRSTGRIMTPEHTKPSVHAKAVVWLSQQTVTMSTCGSIYLEGTTIGGVHASAAKERLCVMMRESDELQAAVEVSSRAEIIMPTVADVFMQFLDTLDATAVLLANTHKAGALPFQPQLILNRVDAILCRFKSVLPEINNRPF